jgi:hypothetical protein
LRYMGVNWRIILKLVVIMAREEVDCMQLPNVRFMLVKWKAPVNRAISILSGESTAKTDVNS